jgi:hypothetical protein
MCPSDKEVLLFLWLWPSVVNILRQPLVGEREVSRKEHTQFFKIISTTLL